MFTVTTACPCHAHFTSEGHLESWVTFRNLIFIFSEPTSAVWFIFSSNSLSRVAETGFSLSSAITDWMNTGENSEIDSVSITIAGFFAARIYFIIEPPDSMENIVHRERYYLLFFS